MISTLNNDTLSFRAAVNLKWNASLNHCFLYKTALKQSELYKRCRNKEDLTWRVEKGECMIKQDLHNPSRPIPLVWETSVSEMGNLLDMLLQTLLFRLWQDKRLLSGLSILLSRGTRGRNFHSDKVCVSPADRQHYYTHTHLQTTNQLTFQPVNTSCFTPVILYIQTVCVCVTCGAEAAMLKKYFYCIFSKKSLSTSSSLIWRCFFVIILGISNGNVFKVLFFHYYWHSFVIFTKISKLYSKYSLDASVSSSVRGRHCTNPAGSIWSCDRDVTLEMTLLRLRQNKQERPTSLTISRLFIDLINI